MNSVLRDIDREKSKMQADVDNLHRHYDKLVGFVRGYIRETTIEWAKLVVSHPQAVLLAMETTRVVDSEGYSYGGDSEPIRMTTLSLANGEMWDQLLHPVHSRQVQGTEYHGLVMADLEEKPTVNEAWSKISEALEDRQVVIFGQEWARRALQTVSRTHVLDDAFCLHNKCREFYGEFYELSLEKVLSYQGIDKRRDELKDSRERLVMLAQVVNNLAVGMEKQSQESETSDGGLNDLPDHPF